MLRLTAGLHRFRFFPKKQMIRFWAKLRYLNWGTLWKIRWALRKAVSANRATNSDAFLSLKNIPTVYINLEKREDRARNIESEFLRIGLSKPKRFVAVEHENGMLGAAKSHLAVLEQFAKSHRSSAVMVCEDDLFFSGNRDEIDQAFEDFVGDSRLDVLCLAFFLKNTTRMTIPGQIKVSDNLLISNEILTQACYIVKPNALPHVMRSLRKSIQLLSAGITWSYVAGDVYWQTLQQGRLFFAIPEKRLARQSAGYSDIWGLYRDFSV